MPDLLTTQPENKSERLVVWFRWFGWLVFAGSFSLGLRLIYEQTILAWQRGPQMVGFSLAHIHGELLGLGMLATVLTHVWLLMFLGRIARGIGVSVSGWVQFVVLALAAASLYVPYGAWQVVTLEIAGPGHAAADQLTDAAGQNQRYLVKALLGAGVPVDARGYYGTALNQACRVQRIDLAHFLISEGANLDLAPDCRAFSEFAARMKPVAPAIEYHSGLPEVPGTSVDVTAPEPEGYRSKPQEPTR